MIDRTRYVSFLEGVSESLDIPPHKYRDAVDHYEAVGSWLESGPYPGCTSPLDIYPQGSFRLGTVVRPVRDATEGDYDIDLVCEIPVDKSVVAPESVKKMVGERLKDNGTYRRLLDEEGKRCWTLEYAENDGVGFHLDILPAVPDHRGLSATVIAITDKHGITYRWSSSDPKGFGAWFDQRNRSAFESLAIANKRAIQSRAPDVYARVEDVPDQLVRTPLQRSIQLMKRHRDLKFDGTKLQMYQPISIIVTSLAAQVYKGELDVYSALTSIVTELHALSALVENAYSGSASFPRGPISRLPNGRWYIPNPVNQDENFADRWHEDNHARARAFFWWISALKEDLVDVLGDTRIGEAQNRLSAALGSDVVTRHLDSLASNSISDGAVPRVRISGATRPWRA